MSSKTGSSHRTQSNRYLLLLQLVVWLAVDWLVRGVTFYVGSLLNGFQQDPSVIYRQLATPGIFGPNLPRLMPVYMPVGIVIVLAIFGRPLTTKLALWLGVGITVAGLICMSLYVMSRHLGPFAWGWQFPPTVLVESSIGVLIAAQIPRYKAFQEES